MTLPGRPDAGLRARKKQATREALSLAALHLALERGLDNVRVDDIAAAAGVSPRTYNNYFSSREQAICAVSVDRAHRVCMELRARPAGEPLREAVVEAMVRQYVGDSEPEKAMIRLITAAPAMRGEFLKSLAMIEQPLARALAERTGTNPEHDLYPRVLAAAVAGAARAATEFWLRPQTTVTFAAVLRDALAVVIQIHPPRTEPSC